MMHEVGFRRTLPDQSSGSVHTFGTPRHPNIANPIPSKRVCFYKSGDPQFRGLRMVINNRTFKTFDALLDSLSKKVPLPFGVRNITTPQGVHAIYTLDDLEDGKSYICSDSRKVKPINLALARKKLPPWYHARPASSRRRTVQQARGAIGHEMLLVRTPKRLLVFRNGEPSVKHTVVLQKRTTETFKSILEYVSELMQFHVVKLHTPDGRRVDGLPALILCSGTVVAAGKEPFRPANYIAHKSPAPLRLPTKRIGVRRLKALNRQKKALLYAANARHFSPSSESYIVNRIHSAIAGSSCELPTHPTNSVDLESSHLLESAAGTEADTCLGNGAEGPGCSLPTEDDIEKSFRVNQDGSMTVEMRVRLTIKEEETLHWTTTLTRSSVANQLTSLPEPEPEIPLPKPNPLDLQNSVSSTDTINKDRNKDGDEDDDDPPSLDSTAFSLNGAEECDRKVHTGGSSPLRAPTPGQKLIRGVQEDMVGSYTFTEKTQNRAVTEQYCMVTQSNTRPVPKPRRFGSVDANAFSPRHATSFKSGLAEILQIESSREEVTETVLHIYEQQTCQDNYHGNAWQHASSTSGAPFYRPATSDTGQFSSSNGFEPELWRPSTASESISIWRAESVSVRSDFTVPLPQTCAVQAPKRQQEFKVGKEKPQQRDKRISLKPKVINKRFSWLTSPSKRQRENSAPATEKRKKAKIYSSAGFIKSIYGGKSKAVTKPKKKPARNSDGGGVAAKSSPPSDDTLKQTLKDPKSENTNRLEVSPPETNPPRGVLARQASMHQEKKSQTEHNSVGESISLPALKSSSAVTKQYVEKWLERSQVTPADDAELEHQRKTEEVKEEKLVLQSVQQRIKSFETKSAPPVEKAPPQSVHCRVQGTEKEQVDPLSNAVINPITPKIPVGSEEKIKTKPVIISVQKATPLNSVCVDLPPPPPAESPMERPTESDADESPPDSNPEDSMTDVPSEASSPLYRHSSVSSETSDPKSGSPASDKTESPTEDAMDVTSAVPEDAPNAPTEAPLQRAPSLKRAPLVSNLSLERKMSLRKACLDNYAVCNDVAAETAASSVPVNTHTGGNERTQQPSRAKAEEKQHLDLRTSPSCCTSVSPASLSSEGRSSSTSVSSSEAPTPRCDPQLKEEQELKTQQVQSPKPAVKKVTIMTSPSPERKPQSKKPTSELPSNSPKPVHHPRDKSMSPNVGPRKLTTPNASPSPDRKLLKSKLQKKLSPYSESLDMVSPPVRHKSNKKMLSRNLSSDNTPETIRRGTPSLTKQTEKSVKSAELEEKITQDSSEALDRTQDNQLNEMDDLQKPDKDGSEIGTQPLNIANQPNMTPVLEKICFSIKSIRAFTQNKRPSCLEKSNSLPDFSSHVASTFGSSSKALLAFLSVMTLRDAIANLNAEEFNANNVSCAEALKMIDSLREIARIEDSHKLQSSLADLQQSTSKQLLDSWRGFQELGSRSTTPNYSDRGETPERDCGIDEIMDGLDIPEPLKEELASLSGEKSESESCSEGKEAAKVIENLELRQNSDANEEEEANVDVRSAIKKFTDIDQLKHADVPRKTRIVIQKKLPGEFKQEKNIVAKSLPDEVQSDCDEKPIYCKVVFEQEGEMVVQPCSDAASEELNQGGANMNASEEDCGLEEDQSEESINHKDFLHDDESASDDEGQKISNLERTESIGSSSKSGKQQQSSEEELEAESEDGKYKSEEEEEEEECGLEEENQSEESINNNDFLHDECMSDDGGQKISNLEHKERTESVSEAGKQSQSSEEELEEEFEDGKYKSEEEEEEEEEEEAPLPTNFVEQNGSVKSESLSEEEHQEQISKDPESDSANTPVREDPSSSEEDQPEIQREDLSKSSPAETAQESSTMPKVQIRGSTGDSDVDEASSSSEEEPPESKELKVIVEESLSEEEQERLEAEELLNHHEEEESKTSKESSAHAEETQICDETTVRSNLSNLIRDQDPVKDSSSLIEESDDLEEHCGFDVEEEEEDSGNDHSSCEEPLEQCKEEEQQIRCSTEEELSVFEKDSSSEEERQQAVPAIPKLSENMVLQSIAERVSLLEKQVDTNRMKTTTEDSTSRCLSQRQPASDADDSSCGGTGTSRAALCTRSAPQSSLSFSYDSSGVITTEPESSRVRSIREMFLAKSAAELRRGGDPSTNRAELSDLRAETSISGGYQSQTSSELSSGEEDSSRTTIAKGFVRRAIERLYGKTEAEPEEPASERPPSAPKKEKKRASSSIFSPFHIASSKAMSELSYFNSSNALDTLTEATRCIAFNAQVGPGDGVPINTGGWLLRENTLIRKSVSDPVSINKSCAGAPKDRGDVCEDAEESTPYSLFSTGSELEEKKKSFTYFSLPNTSDSDVCQDEPSVGEANDGAEKPWAERNGALPAAPAADFKHMDNKVHPLVEGPPHGEAVVVQPGKGQGVVNRRIPEPDVLDLLYNYCGQNCPFL